MEMIWSVELLRLVRPDVLLVIIGDGPHRARLEQYRDQVQVAHHVRFVGERSDVAELLPHFDLFLNTSQYEGQSNAIMEAMQAMVRSLPPTFQEIGTCRRRPNRGFGACWSTGSDLETHV